MWPIVGLALQPAVVPASESMRAFANAPKTPATGRSREPVVLPVSQPADAVEMPALVVAVASIMMRDRFSKR